jgi:molybdopterin/thiamine biosynthesis adenylyltransferase
MQPQEQPSFFQSVSDVPVNSKQVDVYAGSLRELFFIDNPTLRKNEKQSEEKAQEYVDSQAGGGIWIYYPWLNLAIKTVSEEMYFRLRTARNKNLITNEEQSLYRAISVGIAGLSVGSSVLSTIVATGGSKNIKIADPDIIEISNLNRMRASLPHVGENKTHVAARLAWEVDPFAHIDTFPEGLTHSALHDFMKGLDVFIDEMDAIDLKIKTRLVCKELRIPVVMATDNGDSVIVDVERFDQEPSREIFHGRVHIDPAYLTSMTREQFIKLSSAIIDPSLFTTRQRESILEIGKTLSGVAQLASAANIAGAAVAFVVRRIAAQQPMPSGRYCMSCEQAFIPNYDDDDQIKLREQSAKEFKDAVGLN